MTQSSDGPQTGGNDKIGGGDRSDDGTIDMFIGDDTIEYLVHWTGSKTCTRKQSGIDIIKGGNMTMPDHSRFYLMITCPHCRKEAWSYGVR
jgi:hypothetical protein